MVVPDGAGGCDVGLHQELLARSKLYRLLWERQFEAGVPGAPSLGGGNGLPQFGGCDRVGAR